MKKNAEVTIHEAKTHLSRLLQRVSRGETVIIKKGAEPIALLIPIPAKPRRRILGREVGNISVRSDFDVLPNEFLKHFEKE